MNTKPWSHLSNAQLIDWVIESVKNKLELWDAARVASRTVAEGTTWSVEVEESRYSVWDEVWDASTGSVAGCMTAWDALAALVAYDDCNEYLQMTYEQLRVWAILSETPQAVLLLPMKWVQEHEHECLVTTA